MKIPLKAFLIAFTIVAIAASFTYAAKHGLRQDKKEIPVYLTIEDWQTVFTLIDNAAVAGEIRKPLQNKIATQVDAYQKIQAALQKSLPKQDTIKKKP